MPHPAPFRQRKTKDGSIGASSATPSSRSKPATGGSSMGKSNKHKEGQYVPLPYTQLKSPAWRDLSGPAVKLWLELHTRFNGGNNGKLTLSFAEAGEILGMGISAIHTRRRSTGPCKTKLLKQDRFASVSSIVQVRHREEAPRWQLCGPPRSVFRVLR